MSDTHPRFELGLDKGGHLVFLEKRKVYRFAPIELPQAARARLTEEAA